jgi:serine protease Do
MKNRHSNSNNHVHTKQNNMINRQSTDTFATAIKSTVRITSHYETRDIFNPDDVDTQGSGVGSGFFLDDKGHILTCYHVVSNSVKIFVNLPDGGKRSYKAHIISVYPELDIAVIKIHDYHNKYFIEFGVSNECKMGSKTIAIGYPMGDDTVKTTTGSISGIKEHLIQTDAAINEGNSGGPLLNDDYEVIGINSAKLVSIGTEGTGYIIPIDIFKTVMHLMLDESKQESTQESKQESKLEQDLVCKTKSLYCSFQPLEHTTAILINHNSTIKQIEGYMITNMYKESPLAKCDPPMRVHDILMDFNGHKVDNYGDLDSLKNHLSTQISKSMPCDLGRVNIIDYLAYCALDQPVPISFFSVIDQTIHNTRIIFKNHCLYGIPELFYPNQVKFINMKGMIICELTSDHVLDILESSSISQKNKAYIHKFLLSEHREEPRIFISRTLPGSDMIDNKNIENSDNVIITSVNGSPVSTIENFEAACKLTTIIKGKQYVHLEMMNREIATICLDSDPEITDNDSNDSNESNDFNESNDPNESKESSDVTNGSLDLP